MKTLKITKDGITKEFDAENIANDICENAGSPLNSFPEKDQIIELLINNIDNLPITFAGSKDDIIISYPQIFDFYEDNGIIL